MKIEARVLHLSFIPNLESGSLLLFYFELFNSAHVYKAPAVHSVLSDVKIPEGIQNLVSVGELQQSWEAKLTHVKQPRTHPCNAVSMHRI